MKGNIIQEVFGTPWDTFIGYNNSRNFLVVTGLEIDYSRLKQVRDRVQVLNNAHMNTPKQDYKIDMPQINTPITKQIDPKTVDVNELFAKFSRNKK
jgi:hypothetical protein